MTYFPAEAAAPFNENKRWPCFPARMACGQHHVC